LEKFNIFQLRWPLKENVSEIDFKNLVENITKNEYLFFVFPVYDFLVPSQMLKFIHDVDRFNLDKKFQNKKTLAIISSAKICDDFAVNFYYELNFRWNMQPITYYSSHPVNFYEGKVNSNFKKLCKSLNELIVKETNVDKVKSLVVFNSKNNCEKTHELIQIISKNNSASFDLFDLAGVEIANFCNGSLKCSDNFVCPLNKKDEVVSYFDLLDKYSSIFLINDSTKSIADYQYFKMTNRFFFKNHMSYNTNKYFHILTINSHTPQIGSVEMSQKTYFEFSGGILVNFIGNHFYESMILGHRLSNLYIDEQYTSPLTFISMETRNFFARVLQYTDLNLVYMTEYNIFKKHNLFPKNPRRKILNILAFWYLSWMKKKSSSFRNKFQNKIAFYSAEKFNQKIIEKTQPLE
jgi:multimeric flavodoxin WrbA